MSRLLNRIAIAAGLLLASHIAAAADWRPQRPIRIIVPFAAGGPSDTIARIIATEMSEELHTPIYVDNISGAGGATGVKRFLEEARDGHILLMGHMGTHGAAPALKSDLGYDPIVDFAPVGLAASTPMVITVGPNVPAKDLQELVGMMRARGNGVRIAHAGQGSVSHAAAVLLQSAVGATSTLASYPGTGPAMNDILQDRVDVLVDQIVNVAPAIAGKRARALAIVGDTRSEIMPAVATTGEAGVTMKMNAWNGLFVARYTPPDQIAALNWALREALADWRCRARLTDLGAVLPDSDHGTPEALGQLVKDEVVRWSEMTFEIRK
jgi:tripartite-type tricarboxylate transporter receptor subunit TctC